MSGFVAVVIRDLRGASRATAPALGRLLALAGCGVVALAALGSIGPGFRDDLRLWFAGCIAGLMALSLVLSLPQAVGAFRSERSAGTLDLLLLCGLRPGALVAARTLSSFLVLQSVSAAALPGLLLFGFFRTPTAAQALACWLALAAFQAGLAALALAVSAWARRPGTALAAAAFVLPGFAALSAFEATAGSWSAPGLVRRLSVSGSVTGAELGSLLIAHAALVVGAIFVARAGLERHPRPLARSEGRRRRSAGPPCDESRPLSWLMRRTSPAARMRWQLLGLLVALLPLVGLAGWELTAEGALVNAAQPEILSAFGGGAIFVAVAAALAAGATQVAAHRERSAWDEIAASARDAERLFVDLLEATLSAALVPFAAACVLLALAETLRGSSFFDTALLLVGLGASLFFAAVLGLAASACSASSQAAIAFGVLLLGGLPLLVGLLHAAAASGLGHVLVGLAVVVAALTLVFLPFTIRGLGPFLLLLGSSLGEWRSGGRPGPARFLTRPALVLVPLAIVAGAVTQSSEDSWALAFGGLHAGAVHLLTLGEGRDTLRDAPLFGGFLWQSLFALLVLAGTWRHRDLWLGRAAR